MKKAVIFDLDGTLLNTLEDLADSVCEMLEKFGMPARGLDEIRQFVGDGMVKLVERSVSDGFDKHKFEEAYEFFRFVYSKNMRNKTRPYEGIVECLEKLKSLGIKTVVTSNKNDDAVKGLCRDIFGDLLSFSVGVNENCPPKPEPSMVNFAIEKMGLKKEDCIFVGDSDTDILTAKNAGIASVGVLWGFRDEDVLLKAGADFVISKPEDIINIVI